MHLDLNYIDDDYIDAGHFQTGVEIVWGERRIIVPKLATHLIQSTPSEIRELDLDDFRLALKNLEDSPEGMPYPDTHRHNTTVNVGGVTLARVIEIINDYIIEFEDGQYAVNLIGANSNVADRVVVNQVSVRAANSAGLVVGEGGSSLTVEDIVAGVIADLMANHIPVDVKRMNGAQVTGTGTTGDKWRGV
jgi:hypothetical protein